MTAPQHQQAAKKLWTPARLAFTLTMLVLLAAFGTTSCTSPESGGVAKTGAPNSQPTVTVSTGTASKPAPAAPSAPISIPSNVLEMKLNTLDGKPVKLSDYSGKVVVVNLWATWCGPCRQETPDLVELHKQYKQKGVELIGLATEQNDPDLDKVKDFVQQQKVDYPVVYDDGNFTASLVQMAQGRGVIPQSFVISRDGRIVKHFEGFNPAITPAKLREAVDQALNAKV